MKSPSLVRGETSRLRSAVSPVFDCVPLAGGLAAECRWLRPFAANRRIKAFPETVFRILPPERLRSGKKIL